MTDPVESGKPRHLKDIRDYRREILLNIVIKSPALLRKVAHPPPAKIHRKDIVTAIR
jgi:hypothetical protein